MAQNFHLDTLRDRITSTLNRFSNFTSEMLSNPETAPSLSRLLAAVEQGPPTLGGPSLPRQSPAIEDMASKLPKGLRVEDLKPPPSKRQKGKSGQSPAVQTPDNPKTPSVAADSPANIPTSAQSKKPTGTAINSGAGAGANKRKRQSSNAAALKTPKFAAPLPKIEPGENSQHKVFFDAQAALTSGHAEPWAAITSAMQEFEAAKVEAAKIALGQTSILASAAVPTSLPANGPSDDELFAEFMDLDASFFPTPELLSDLVDDYSPESIRTVGSVKPMPWPLADESPINAKSELASKYEIVEEDGENGLAFMSVPQSPESMAYNGGLVFG